MKANYELTRIGVKLKTSLLLLLLFLAAVFQLQAQVQLVSSPISGHYCGSDHGVQLGIIGGDAIRYVLWKDNVVTTYFIDGPGGTAGDTTWFNELVDPLIFTYGTYSLNGPFPSYNEGNIQVVTRDVLPTPAISASASTTTCRTDPETVIYATGGSGTTFNWYTGSCGGTLVGGSATSTLTVSPTVTTTYYGRWENATCPSDYSGCVSVTITVENTDAPTITSIAPTICSGGITEITTNAVAGMTLQWYTGGCGVGHVATTTTSAYTTSALTQTTTYWVRKLNGQCDPSACASVTVTISNPPIAPTAITGTPATICQGTQVALTADGTGGVVYWYANTSSLACPGLETFTVTNTGTLTVSPTVTTYYSAARYIDNVCGMSACASGTITVKVPPVAPTAITPSANPICSGSPVTLTENGSGSGSVTVWSETGCSAFTATSTSYTVTPTVTKMYYAARYIDATCGYSTCAAVTITVDVAPVAPANITGTTPICRGTETTLTAHGSGGVIGWYSAKGSPTTCPSSFTVTSTSHTLTVSPTETTTYYAARSSENTCGWSTCASVTITVDQPPVAPTAITLSPTTNPICTGNEVTLTANGIGGDVYWHIGTCPTILYHTATSTGSLTVSPTIETVYYAARYIDGTCTITTCASVTVQVSLLNLDPTPITTSPGGTTVCKGQGVTLTTTHPDHGGGTAYWYSGDAGCVGTFIKSGVLSITVYPEIRSRYFVHFAGGNCPTSNCVSITIDVAVPPVAPTTITPSANPVCSPAQITLTANGSGGVVYWNEGACPELPATYTATSTGSLTVTPTDGITYYAARYIEANCGMSACASVTITVDVAPTAPTSISLTPSKNPICSGNVVTLSVPIKKFNGYYGWFASPTAISCPGSYTVTNTGQLTVSPTRTTYYYVAAFDKESCGWSTCASVTVTVVQPLAPPTEVTATPPVICKGESTVLEVLGHSLGTGETVVWYTGTVGVIDPCGSFQLTATNVTTLTVAPTLTTIYYARYNSSVCGDSDCRSVTVIVSDVPQTPTSISAPVAICSGQTTNLTAVYNSTGAGINLVWYDEHSEQVGTGSPLPVTPAHTTTYYAREESDRCDPSSSLSVTITVYQLGDAPIITSPERVICNTNAETYLTATEVTGGTLTWHTGSCSGTPVGSGSRLDITVGTLTQTTVYYVNVVYECGVSVCASTTVTVETPPAPPTFITGPFSMCSAKSEYIEASGGTGTLKWYSDEACLNYLGTGSPLTISPTTGTCASSAVRYFARNENSCTSAIVSVTVTVTPENLEPTIISNVIQGNNNTICSGDDVTLTAVGGGGLILKWYTGSQPCDDSYPFLAVGACSPANTITVAPIITSRYYAHYEGGECDPSGCVSILITVSDVPKQPTGISNDMHICSGDAAVLSATYNNTGAGISLNWYQSDPVHDSPADCESSLVAVGTISGNTLTVTPTVTTTYYAREESFSCEPSYCLSVTITVDDKPSLPTVEANSIICSGVTIELDATLTAPSAGNELKWYSDVRCWPQHLLFTGSPLIVSPTNTDAETKDYRYYVRAESLQCSPSGIASVTVTVRALPVAPSSLSGNPNPLCNNGTTYTDISASGGLGNTIYWYNGSAACVGTFVATGTTIHVAPILTTIYFAKYSNECGFSDNCTSVLITVNDMPLQPAVIAASVNPVCNNGGSTVLSTTYTHGAGVTLHWYQYVGANPPSCYDATAAVGTVSGNFITVTPTVTTTYYARTESGGCTASACRSITIVVSDVPTIPTNLTGPSTVCVDQPIVLTANYNSTGAGVTLNWYNTSCGVGALPGSGSPYTYTPTTATAEPYNFFARSESVGCPSTSCVSITTTVYPEPFDVTLLTASSTSICRNSSVTLTANGEFTTGAVLNWYTNSCGGTLIGTTTNTKSFTHTPVATTSYYAQYSNSACWGDCASVTVSVTQAPTPPVSLAADPPSPICIGHSTTLSAVGGSGTTLNWYSGSLPCSDPLVATGTVIVVFPQVSPTQYSARWVNECGISACGPVINIYLDPLTVSPTSITSDIATIQNNTVCVNTPVTMTVNGGSGTTLNWYEGDIACPTTNGAVTPTYSSTTSRVFTVNKTTPGTYTYKAQWTNSCAPSECRSYTFTVYAVPGVPEISASKNPTCAGDLVTLTATADPVSQSGSTLYWYKNSCDGTFIVSGVNTLNVTPTATTTYFAHYENAACHAPACASITITVYATPVAPSYATATPNEICGSTATTVLHAESGSGVTLNWYASCESTQILYTGNNITVTPTISKTYYARWDNGNACTSGCVSASVTVCNPNVAPTSATVSVNAVCVGNTVLLSAHGGTGGWYAWYKGGCGVGTSIGEGASLTVTPTVGRNDYYVRYENTSCEASACKSVTVTAYSVPVAPTTVSANPTTVCVGATTVLRANGDGDELKWYSGSCEGTYVGSGSPLTVTVTGLTTYYAKWTNLVCESSCKSVTVTTYPAMVAPTAYAVDPDICIGESDTLMRVGGSGDVLNWYTSPSGGTPLATNVNSVIVSPIVTTTYYVRWESSNGCPPSAMASVTVRVQTPQPVISGPQSLCQYNLVAPYFVIGAPQTGHVYVWKVIGLKQNGDTLSNSTTQGPTLTNSGDGHVSIAWGTETAHGQLRVTETNEFGCSTTTGWYDVYMIRPIAPISITGPGQICQSTVQSYHTTLVPGATQYNWTVPSTWSIQAGSGTYSITVLVGTVSGDVTVAAANTCGASASISKAVIVDQVPVSPGTITGDQTPCQGETNVGYSVTAVSGITYTWTYSGNGVHFTGDGTASIVATFDNNATAGSWWVYAANSCGTGGYSTLSVTPDLLPGTIGVISGNSPVCQGVSGITYSIASIANVPSNGYTWKVPAGATISGTTTTNQIVVNFSATAVTENVTVYGTNACGSSATASKTVTVNPLPGAAGTISGNTTPCQGAVNVSYTVPVISDATYYTWVYSGTNVTLGAQGTRTMTLTFANNATSGNLTVIGSNDCGNGTISAALAIVVSPLPGAAQTITGDSPVCQNTPHTYTVPPITNATSYFWAYDGTGATYSNTTTINQVTISFGTIAGPIGNLTVYGKNDCGNGVVSAAKVISVNTMPTPEVFGDVVMCAGTIDKVYYTTAFAGQTYEWRCSGGEITDGQNTPQITVDWGYGATGSVYVIATKTATGCIGQSALKVVTLNPLPAPVISGATTVTAYSVQPYSTPNVAGHLYTWDVIGGEVSSGDHTSQVEITWGPMGSGTITVFETNSATGCVGQTSVPVTIGSAGTLTLSGAVTYDNVHHTGLRGVSVTLKHGATVIDSTVTGANGLYQFNSLSAGTYSVTASFSGPVGSINATDANLVQQEAVNHEGGPLAGLRLSASLVRGIGIWPTSFDAQLIMQRFVGWITTFPAGDWIFENASVTLGPLNGVQDLKGLCYGDVNGSFYPTGAKELSFLSAVDDGVITVPVNESFTYEIRSNAVADLGAMSLVMNYDQTRFNVEEVVASLNGMESKIADGQVRVAWSNTKALSLNADAPVISLQVTAKETMTQPEQIFTIGEGSEFADQSGIRINNFDLKMASVVTPENATSFFMYNYPNPFRNMTEIVYSIPEDGKVTLVMTNMYGQTIRTLVDEAKAAGTYKVKVDASDGYLTPGVYLYRIEVDGTTNSYNKTNKMMLTR